MEATLKKMEQAKKELIQKELISSLQEARQSGEFCDLRIRCQGHEWEVHRLVVCMLSSFFSSACRPNFAEGFSGVIDFKEEDPVVVGLMLDWMYTLDYSDQVENPDEAHNSPTIINALVYAMADRYDIQSIKSWCTEKFEVALRAFITTLRHSLEPLRHLIKLTDVIYKTTPHSDMGFRTMVIPVIVYLMPEVEQLPEFHQLTDLNVIWVHIFRIAVSR